MMIKKRSAILSFETALVGISVICYASAFFVLSRKMSIRYRTLEISSSCSIVLNFYIDVVQGNAVFLAFTRGENPTVRPSDLQNGSLFVRKHVQASHFLSQSSACTPHIPFASLSKVSFRFASGGYHEEVWTVISLTVNCRNTCS